MSRQNKKGSKETVGRKKAGQLVEAAEGSVGVDYGEEAARLKLRLMLEELELLEKQTEELEAEMEAALEKTDYAEFLLSIKGIGVVTLAACLGELGNPTRFENPRQMSRMAGYNLVEDSSARIKAGQRYPNEEGKTCGVFCIRWRLRWLRQMMR